MTDGNRLLVSLKFMMKQ